MSAPAAVIFGCEGPILTGEEAAFFRAADPWGFILFARNCVTPAQMTRLTADLRGAVGRDAPILIDQEGGRVARMRGPHWTEWPSMADFVAGAPDELTLAGRLRARGRRIAEELRAVGVDVNCVPLLDVPQPGSHGVIGSRALGTDPLRVALRARALAQGTIAGGALPVVKHLPGHGRATADSHEALPVVTAPLEALRETDFAPFVALADLPLGMTAHVVYSALDDRPATLSPVIIRLIRDEIGFDGLLMTDDLSMNALTGPLAGRVRGALGAGVDVILHCNGDLAAREEVRDACALLDGRALARARRAEAARPPAPLLLAAEGGARAG